MDYRGSIQRTSTDQGLCAGRAHFDGSRTDNVDDIHDQLTADAPVRLGSLSAEAGSLGRVTDFRHNHYVPRWYQGRFLPGDMKQRELYYLDKEHRIVLDSRGRKRRLPEVEPKPLKKCFALHDLYTLTFRDISSTDLEQRFFGRIDRKGQEAVEFWTDFAHKTAAHDTFQDFLVYLSTQRLRTPKGLDWLSSQINTRNSAMTLAAVVRFQQVFGAIWAESVWQIADSTGSATKFMLSDHPVTVYNRAFSPASAVCRGSGDPDIRLNGTHTIFALSMNKVLILTNRSWALNPWGSPTMLRPNPRLERNAMFNQLEVQIDRQLDEDEVRRINYIIKARASRFVAAAERDWLYPERHLGKVSWNKVTKDFLLFPDPRELHYGGEIIVGYASGRTMSTDTYGRTLVDPNYGKDTFPAGPDTLGRFQGEFAYRFGRRRRGRGWEAPEEDSEAMHAYYLKKLEPAVKREETAASTTASPRYKRKRRRRP